MKRAIVWFCGLNTSVDSDWCGIRPCLEEVAGTVAAELVGAEWNQPGVAGVLDRFTGYNFLVVGGHSHGAWREYEILMGMPRGSVAVAAFLDMAPFADPLAWTLGSRPVPAAAKRALCFYQRLDMPLCGVKLSVGVGGSTELKTFDVSGWGLGHSEMVGDSRVQDRLKLEILRARNDGLHSEFLERVS